MDRGTRNLFALAVVVVIVVTGGAALILDGTGSDPASPEGGSFMDGVIVGVEAESLNDVQGFSLRRNGDGAIVEFDLGALENATEFPPGHLAEHQATSQPVRVWYRDEGGTLLAIRLADEPR
jgi:hypothetical protein